MIPLCLLSLATCTYPPSPGPESWSFRDELARPMTFSPAVVKDKRTAWLSNRISRCYFSPIKRPPFNRDELADGIDYYPEPYLQRLHDECINGLWITIEFEDLLAHPERFAKLKSVSERCEKFGIKVWLFAIEPKAVDVRGGRYGESPNLFPCGNPWDSSKRLWCASDARTLKYLHDSIREIFSRVPALGGLLAITHGERACSCFSAFGATDDTAVPDCAVCAKREPWRLHWALTEALVSGMREVNPKAEMLSWFYMPYATEKRAKWVSEVARHLPPGVTLLANFESGIVCTQLGKARIGGDYWLSAVGPARPFDEIAAAARESGVPFGAKIQVGCSHEDATLPFIPVPGLLYRKYKAMHDAGCSSVLQCWYFGNYPGVMNKAAGRLAFSDFSEGEKGFLLELAREDWGEDAEEVSEIWESLADAYSRYPLSNAMQYYGPFHAGAVWPLEPDLELKPLGRTWVCEKEPAGDAICECLADHTMAEALELARQMRNVCEPVVARLDRLACKYESERERFLDVGVMRALTLQFASAFDIFDFYAARAEAVVASRESRDVSAAKAALARMRAVVEREQAVTRKMLVLSLRDSRLGFHSEAEAHQFFPRRLEWRLRSLKETGRRLDEIDAAVSKGNPYPLSDWERNAVICATDGKWIKGRELRFQLLPDGRDGVRLVIETSRDSKITVCTYDVAGVQFPREREIEIKDGRGECAFRIAEGDRLMLMRDDGIVVWPGAGKELEYRLVLGHAWANSCGRCTTGKGS